MLIDDDPAVREDLELFLEPNADVIWAPGSRQAMVLLKYGVVPDVVILDLCLPPFLTDLSEKEGLELLSAMRRKLAPEIPIVVLTSLGRDEAGAACMERGAHTFLEKPCEVKELAELIRDLSGTRRR